MAVTGWISSHRDRTDNVLVIGPNLSDNPTFFDEEKEWYADVLGEFGSPGRFAVYLIQEVLGGTSPASADDCAWTHAVNGEQDGQLWNGSGTDADDTSSPVCRSLAAGDAALDSNTEPAHSLLYSGTPGDLVSDSMEAQIRLGTRGVYILPVRDNLGPVGVVGLTSTPEDDGVPADVAGDAVLEWRTPDIEVTKVEFSLDAISRPTASTVVEGMTAAARDSIAPTMTGGVWSPYTLGAPGGGIEATYRDGDPDYVELTGLLAGDTGWDNAADPDTDAPDEVIIFGTERGMSGLKPAYDAFDGPGYDVTVRFTLRSPEYRWVYPGANPVTRQYPRDDGRGVSSAPRLHPPTKAARLHAGYM